MKKSDLIAALSDDSFDREALLEALTAEAEKTSPFRERPSVREHIESFNTARKDMFQPAVYRKDPEALASALREMITALNGIANEAGVLLEDEE